MGYATPPKMDWKVRKMHRLVAARHTCHKLDAFFKLEQLAPTPLRQGAAGLSAHIMWLGKK
jgi:hypothetical protein